MNSGSLFSGIGGIELGLKRADIHPAWFAESDAYAREQLLRNFPGVPVYADVREIDEHTTRVDVISGGFPCQPFSAAGRQLGIADERWMWPEFARVVRLLRPRYVIVENVPALLRDAGAFGWVLRDLHESGFDAEWSTVWACSMGAPHPRERLFIVAYPRGERLQGLYEARGRVDLQPAPQDVRRYWAPEPGVARVADGVPRRLVLDAIRCYGNAVVPQVAEWIGRRLMEAENA